MSSLNLRGGTTIKNRILSGASADQNCDFGVKVFQEGGSYKASIRNGFINWNPLLGNQIETSIPISPPCSIVLELEFTNEDYEYVGGIKAKVIEVPEGEDVMTDTLVEDQGGSYKITTYVYIANIEQVPGTAGGDPSYQVRQLHCGSIDFRMYFTTVNGAPYVDFFRIIGLWPGEVPIPDE